LTLPAHLRDTVSTTDAAREAGLSYRQVSYWIAMKAITPVHGNGGSGSRYRFTVRQAEHLVQIGRLYRLLEALDGRGPQTDFIRRVWNSLEATGTFRYDNGPIVITLPWPPETELLAGA
jgi:hypothetical protein